MAVFLLPDVVAARLAHPTAVLSEPSIKTTPASNPTTVLLFPLALFCSALKPIATLASPEEFWRAEAPTATFAKVLLAALIALYPTAVSPVLPPVERAKLP